MTPAVAGPTFAQVEQAALQVLRLVSDIPGLEGAKIAVIGDLAVCHYLPHHERPASIDFIVSRSSSLGRVRKEIVSHPMSPLVERSGAVFFPLASRQEIEVKLIPDWLCPYLPAAACSVDVKVAAIPYISIEDLLVFKVDACGLRERESSKRREACDAASLLELAAKHTSLKLPETKLQKIQEGLEEIVEHSSPEYDKSWWQRSLGQVPDRQRLASEILSDLSLGSPQPKSPTPSSKASSIYSTMSRTSSSLSTISASSACSSTPTTPTQDDRSPEKNGRPRKMSVTSRPSRHSRHRSTGGSSSTLHVSGLDIGRPESPGVALCNLG